MVTPEFAAAIHRVLESPGTALQYGIEQGNPALIDYLAGRIRRIQHIPLTIEEIMIVAGSTHANDLIARLCARGGSLIVEAPTYADALPIYRDNGVEIHSVPIDSQGVVVAEFEALLKRLPNPPRLFYTIPNFHNPTGIPPGSQRRRSDGATCFAWLNNMASRLSKTMCTVSLPSTRRFRRAISPWRGKQALT
jgi:DNA-binding transcriptional MocR family regulator